MTSGATPPSAERHFLWRWFQVLDKRLLLSDRHALDAHNVRVEASGTSDWWIQVQPPAYERCHGCGFYATHETPTAAEQQKHLRELREALVLVTMYARIDNAAWLHEMTHSSGLRFLRKTKLLLARFSFVVSGGTHTDGCHPAELLASVFEAAQPACSAGFSESVALLKVLAEQSQTPIDELLAPIPIRIEFSQLSKRDGDSLSHVSNAVTSLSEAKRHDAPYPKFELDCVELRLRRHDMNASTLSTIDTIVDSGVRIKYLELPKNVDDPVDTQGLHAAWRSLAYKLFRPEKEGATTQVPQVERLELPSVYFTTDLAAAWLPLLATATNVRSLTIDGGVEPSETPRLPVSSLAWVSLCYALFSSAANNSVESLQLSGVDNIEMEASEAMIRVVNSPSPQLELLRVVEQQPRIAHSSLDSSTTFGRDQFEPTASSNSRKSRLRRLVLRTSSTQIPGDESGRIAANITKILLLGGRHLTDLAIDGAHLSDSELRKWLELCPSLESLRITSGALDTLQDLVNPHRKLSSLDLRSIQTPEDAFLEFVRRLTRQDHTARATLDRLSIGQGWSGLLGASAPHLLYEMLTSNHSLSFLHVFRPNDMFTTTPSSSWNMLKEHDGTFIASRDRPLSMDRKIALLASTKKLVKGKKLPQLNHDVLAHVFQYAASPRRRSVLVETDGSSSLM